MIRKFEVKNYKNFKDTLVLDFTKVRDYQYNEHCVKNGLINKMIIYGKNAVGKSNLMLALFDIFLDNLEISSGYDDKWLYKNANAKDNELIEFKYSFLFDSDIVDYIYKKKDSNYVVSEELCINNKKIFSYDLINKQNDFSNVSDVNAGELNWVNFINALNIKETARDIAITNLTALRYIMHNTVQSEESIIGKMSRFIKGMRFASSSQNKWQTVLPPREYFDKATNLKRFQKFLNDNGVECKLVLLDQPDGKKDLYFDYTKPLHFLTNLSSGTASLVKFYFQYLARIEPTFIFIDEFDAYYHFELSEKIVDILEKEFDCQVILTTHNTNLLSNSIMRPDCFAILSDGKLTSICDATSRELRQGHNLEKLYKNGEFDG